MGRLKINDRTKSGQPRVLRASGQNPEAGGGDDPGAAVRIYDDILESSRAAIESIKKHRIENSHRNIRHAEDLVTELLLLADPGTDPRQAKVLKKIHFFLAAKLLESNVTKNTVHLELVMQIVSALRDSQDNIFIKLRDIA